jgi:hypothetical protein
MNLEEFSNQTQTNNHYSLQKKLRREL